MSEPTAKNQPPTTTSGNWIHFLFSGVLLLVCMVLYQSSQSAGMRKEVDKFRTENQSLQQSLAKSDHELQQALTDFHTEVDQLKTELQQAHHEAGQAKAVAVQHADELDTELAQARRAEELRQSQIAADLNRVKQSTNETATRLNGISSEVESVKSAATETSTGLDRTRGNLGAMSGLIATNAEQIQMLRQLGDRNVYEFKLSKGDGLRKVGDIQVAVEKLDPKKNQFTVQILAGDQKVEKRDRTVNEPVQFYVPGKVQQVYELVVNQIGKNTVTGYLTTPKIAVARDGAERLNAN